MAFADNLRKILSEKKMKAVDLARATGLSEAIISDYLKGKKEPRGRQSISIAKALNISLDTLWEVNYRPSDKDKVNTDTVSKVENDLDPLDIDDDVKHLARQYSLLNTADRELVKKMINSLAEKIDKT